MLFIQNITQVDRNERKKKKEKKKWEEKREDKEKITPNW